MSVLVLRTASTQPGGNYLNKTKYMKKIIIVLFIVLAGLIAYSIVCQIIGFPKTEHSGQVHRSKGL